MRGMMLLEGPRDISESCPLCLDRLLAYMKKRIEGEGQKRNEVLLWQEALKFVLWLTLSMWCNMSHTVYLRRYLLRSRPESVLHYTSNLKLSEDCNLLAFVWDFFWIKRQSKLASVLMLSKVYVRPMLALGNEELNDQLRTPVAFQSFWDRPSDCAIPNLCLPQKIMSQGFSIPAAIGDLNCKTHSYFVCFLFSCHQNTVAQADREDPFVPSRPDL